MEPIVVPELLIKSFFFNFFKFPLRSSTGGVSFDF